MALELRLYEINGFLSVLEAIDRVKFNPVLIYFKIHEIYEQWWFCFNSK